MLDKVDSSGNHLSGGAYEVIIDPTSKNVVIKKDDIVEEINYTVDSSGNCHSLSNVLENMYNCTDLITQITAGKDADISTILENLNVKDKYDLLEVNPKVLYDLLVALYWPIAVEKMENNNVSKRTFANKFDKYVKFLEDSKKELDTSKLKLDDKVKKFLEDVATYLNEKHPKLLNQVELMKLPENSKFAEFSFTYPIKIATFNVDKIKLFSQLFEPRIVRRNTEFAKLAFIPNTIFTSPLYSMPPMTMFGGGSNEQTNLFNDLISYYRTSVAKIKKAIEQTGKKIDSSINKQIDKRLDNFEKSGKEFGESLNLITKYHNLNKQVMDSKLFNITEDDMKNHIEAFENRLQTFTKSEINILKIITKLQEALSKISLEENIKLIAPR